MMIELEYAMCEVNRCTDVLKNEENGFRQQKIQASRFCCRYVACQELVVNIYPHLVIS